MNSFIDFLFPPACVKCGDAGVGLCPDCASGLTAARTRQPPDGLDECLALFEYEDIGRSLIHAYKFRRRRDAVGPLSFAMARLVCHLDGDLTWAPTSDQRRRERGFDQAELLARSIAKVLGRNLIDLLERTHDQHQTGRSRKEREEGPHFEPRIRPPRSLIIVDDVWTTGSTLRAAAYTARAVGAVNVYGLVLASVSAPSDS